MDVLSEVVSSARAGQAMARRVRESGPWGWGFPSFEGVGSHIIQLGSPWLITADGEPVILDPRDTVFAGHGTEHALGHRPATLAELPEMAPPVIEAVGSEAADVDFLCGAYRLNRGSMQHLLQLLPHSVCVLRDYDRHPDLRSIVGLLEENVSRPQPGAEVTRAALIDLLLVRVLTVRTSSSRAAGPRSRTRPSLSRSKRFTRIRRRSGPCSSSVP